jgi:hypothetical protein
MITHAIVPENVTRWTLTQAAGPAQSYRMKRLLVGLAALLIAGWPVLSHAQYDDEQTTDQYNDVEDGQSLKVISYLLTPFGMALEWGLTRPLHYVATQTSAGPIIAGDTETTYFGENDNADLLPPGTFAPHVMTGQYSNYSFQTPFVGTTAPGVPIQPATVPPAPPVAPQAGGQAPIMR